MPKKHRARKAVLAGAAAAGLSSALVVGTTLPAPTTDTMAHRDVMLASTVIGIGGRDDGDAIKLKKKLDGNYALGVTGTFVPIHYPASLLFQSSIDDGAPKLGDAIATAGPGRIRVVSYSEGTLVAEKVKRDLAASSDSPAATTLDFVFIASPYVPNGGIFSRFPGFQIPGLLPVFSAAQPTKYDSTYVTNEYDGFADFPAYFNPVSIANALLGMVYAHPDQYYDGIKLDDLVEGKDKFTYATDPATGDNGAGGHDTYILVYNPHLPLFAPIRQIAALTSLTPLTEPALAAIEPLVRLVVDMGYTDRTNANPAKPTPFSFVTPPQKVVEAVTGVPGAIEQGAEDAQSGGHTSVTPTGPGLTAVPGTGTQNRQLQETPQDSSETKDGAATGTPNTGNPGNPGNPGNTANPLDEKLPKKPAPTGPFAAIASALKAFGVPQTKTTNGNKVTPTTIAGTSTPAGGNTNPEPSKLDSPSDTVKSSNDAAA